MKMTSSMHIHGFAGLAASQHSKRKQRRTPGKHEGIENVTEKIIQFSLVLIRLLLNFMIFTFMIHDLILWPEFGLKPRYVALHVTENRKRFFLNIVPPFIRDHIDSVDCTLVYKATVGRRFRMKGGRLFIKKSFSFPLDVMQNSVV